MKRLVIIGLLFIVYAFATQFVKAKVYQLGHNVYDLKRANKYLTDVNRELVSQKNMLSSKARIVPLVTKLGFVSLDEDPSIIKIIEEKKTSAGEVIYRAIDQITPQAHALGD